ncbi:MAG: enoyl-CoA hydratase/isomerase family protein [Halorientalis sp.]
MTAIDVMREDAYATVTISNPERKNAISAEACQTMAAELRELAVDDAIRCVVVAGAGEDFCSGIDLAEGIGGASVSQELETGLNAIATALMRMEKPTVASVTGACVGAGASIATACDFVYAEEGAQFGWGFTDIGLAPDTGATYVLPRLVGVRRALDLLMTGRRIDAERAVDLGIATEAIPAEVFTETVAERVAMLTARPTLALGETKRLVQRNSHRSLEQALRAEARAQERMILTDDFSEGVQAFFQGRDPEFQGQ